MDFISPILLFPTVQKKNRPAAGLWWNRDDPLQTGFPWDIFLSFPCKIVPFLKKPLPASG